MADANTRGLMSSNGLKKGQELGAGEILLTSIDQEGTQKGFDTELVRRVSGSLSIPVIASGGMGSADHLVDVATNGLADAVAIADVLHFNRIPLSEIKEEAAKADLPIRFH